MFERDDKRGSERPGQFRQAGNVGAALQAGEEGRSGQDCALRMAKATVVSRTACGTATDWSGAERWRPASAAWRGSRQAMTGAQGAARAGFGRPGSTFAP